MIEVNVYPIVQPELAKLDFSLGARSLQTFAASIHDNAFKQLLGEGWLMVETDVGGPSFKPVGDLEVPPPFQVQEVETLRSGMHGDDYEFIHIIWNPERFDLSVADLPREESQRRDFIREQEGGRAKVVFAEFRSLKAAILREKAV